MRRIGAVAAACALVAGLAVAPLVPAVATTPGTNGLIAFVRGTTDCHDIYLVRSDGGITKLTKCPRLIGAPAWSPNAKRMAVSYVGRSGGLNLKLGLLNATGGSITSLSTGVGTSNSPVFSGDGATLAFAGGDGGEDNLAIYTVPVGGGNATKLVGVSGEANDEPDWSPSADVIAWSHKPAMSPTFDVWAMTVDANGRNPTAMTDLTTGQGNSRYPSWSPDGTKLAFASDRSGSWQIYVMDADGSNVLPMTSGGNHIQPAWSPDGTQIAFTTGCTTAGCETSGPNGHRQNGDLQVIDVTDLSHPGAPQTVADTPATEFDPQWAPACSGSGCPVTAIDQRTVRLKPFHHQIAKGRVVASGTTTACHAHVPLVLQYENVIDRGPKWHHGGHWVTEGRGATTATGRYRLHLPPRLTGWYRVKAKKVRAGSHLCLSAASRLRVNNFVKDPKGDSRGPVDIAWGDASLRNHVVTFTLRTYRSFSKGQLGTPCILFMKRVRNSDYGGAIGCFGGLLLHDQHKPITTRRPDSKTIVYTFKESELGRDFTDFEWGPWSRGSSDHDFYDVAPNDFELGNPNPEFDAWDTPYFFKHKPAYHP